MLRLSAAYLVAVAWLVSTAFPREPVTPEKSSLKIKETAWTENFKTDPKEAKESQKSLQLQNPGVNISVSTKCRGVSHKFLFTPTVSLGKDAGTEEPELNFWVIEEIQGANTRRKEARLTAPRAYSDNPPVASGGDVVAPVEHGYMEWRCSCCRSMNKNFLGWYAELKADGTVLATAKSALVPKAQKALDEFLEAGGAPARR
jgi:hypothetical protein